MPDLLWDWSYKCSILTTQTKCKGGSGTFTTTDQQASGGDLYYLVTGSPGRCLPHRLPLKIYDIFREPACQSDLCTSTSKVLPQSLDEFF
jgi:hypothetical protein